VVGAARTRCGGWASFTVRSIRSGKVIYSDQLVATDAANVFGGARGSSRSEAVEQPGQRCELDDLRATVIATT
jgi:hypothetical protein